MKKFSFAFAAVALLAPVAAPAQWSALVTSSQVTTISGKANFNPGSVAVSPTGVIAFTDIEGSDDLYTFNPAGSVLTRVATGADVIAALDAVNPATITGDAAIRDIAWLQNGLIAAYVSDTGNLHESIVTINPSGGAISVLVTDTGSGNPTGALSNIETIGNTIYGVLESSFGATNDSLFSVNAAASAPAGNYPMTTVADEASLAAAAGETTVANLRINDLKAQNSTTLIGVNSGGSASNDNFITINVAATNSAAAYLNATDVEADLGAIDASNTDIGLSGFAIAGGGDLFAFNKFANTGASADDSVLRITGVTPPNGTTTIFTNEATLGSDLGAAGADYGSVNDRSISYDSANNRLIGSFNGNSAAADAIAAYSSPTNVSEWMHY